MALRRAGLAPLTLAVLACSGPAARAAAFAAEDQEPSLYGQVEALSRQGAPFEELARLLPRCAAQPSVPAAEAAAGDRAFDCARLFAALAERADAGVQGRLWAFHDRLPGTDVLRPKLVEAVLEARFRRALRGLLSVPAAGRASADDEDPAAALEQGREQLARLRQSYRELFQEAQRSETVEVQTHWSEFYASLAEFLRERSTPAQSVQRLARFQWGGVCGTGADRMAEPQDRALFLALLAEGRHELAAGAVLAIFTSFGGFGGFGGRSFDEPSPPWTAALRAAGVDDQAVLAAAAAGGSEKAALAVAGEASARGAGLLLEAFERPVRGELDDAWRRRSLLPDLAALVSRGPSCGAAPDRGELLDGIPERRAPPLPEAIQRRALAVLARSAGSEAGLAEASLAAHLLMELCRRESLPTFRAMLESPFGRVRERGERALVAWKQPVARARPSAPVLVRVLVDGRPLASQPVAWGLRFAPEIEGLVEQSSHGAQTDASGVLRLDRDEFSDPRMPVARIELRSTSERMDEPLFLAHGLPPVGDREIGAIEIQTQSLEIVLPDAPGPLQVMLRSALDLGGMPADAWQRSFEGEGGRRLTLPRLQRGRYVLGAYTRETPSRAWYAGPIELGEGPLVVSEWRQRQ